MDQERMLQVIALFAKQGSTAGKPQNHARFALRESTARNSTQLHFPRVRIVLSENSQ
eukprot:CAMPEP_0182514456 /NCGR_PEP_ID=MMETSP1321-20130603/35778_1 /TAXON_ID=91990 /ORGANISM="Bolidomonas sp., Strain RCC1657" /LENGTH=56 /DNA_ID=CAMNT_0024721653 /DNA_START=62 /DNA_END=229 /DNA_ORIENTATION=-